MLVRMLVVMFLVFLAVRFLRKLLPPAPPDPTANGHTRPRSHPDPRSPYDVLGVTPEASSREIRRAYQSLMRQYHPDRLEDMAPELRALAEQRTKEINAAYDQLKRT